MLERVAPLLLVLLLGGGCAHSVQDLARETTRAAVDESVDELTAEDSKKQLAEAAADPRVQEGVANLTDQVTEGVLRALEDPRTQKSLQGITGIAARTITQQLLATLGSPAMATHMEKMTENVTQAAMRGVGSALQNDFMPGLKQALARDLSEGAAMGLKNGQFNDALGVTAQNVAYNAVLGVNDGLRTSWLGDTGDDVRGMARAGIPWLKLAFWSLVLITLCLLSAAAIVIARTRRARAEVMRLEAATLLLATAMRERHESAETDEIVTVVRDALEKSAQEHQRHGLLGILRLRHHH